jgi:translation initiation factor 2A
MTATLSPRLRVDNGVKIWWCGGQLLHIHLQEELYSVTFQPSLIENTPTFPSVLPAAPEPDPSVALNRSKGESTNGRKCNPLPHDNIADLLAETKPAGAYRPPGARGAPASDVYRRDDSDDTPMFKGGKPAQRYIPGSIPGAPAPKHQADGNKKKKNKKKTENGVAPPVGEMEKTTIDSPAASEAPATDDAIAKKVRNLEKKVSPLPH